MSYPSQLEVVVKVIDEASREFERIGEAVEETSSKFSTLKDIAKTAAGVLIGEVAHDALGALTRSLNQASENFTDLELTLTRITASMGKTGAEAKALRDEFQKIVSQQTDLGYSAVEAAQALESLVKAGLEGEEAVKALRASLEMARIENIDTAQAADMLTAVMNQFKLSADDASRVVDVLVNASAAGRGTASEFAEGLKYVGTMASSMGLSLEETVAALVALNNSGLEATTAGRYLAGMLSDLTEKGRGIIPTWDNFNNLIRQGKISMEDAIAIFDKLVPSLGLSKLASEDLEKAWHELTNAVEEGKITQDQIAEALKKAGFEVNKLGFEIYNADGSMKSLNEIITLLTNKLNSFATQAEKDAYINQMFGEQSRRAVLILTQQSDQLTNLTNKLAETGSTAMMVNEIMNTTAGRLAKVNAESQNASLGFGSLTAQVKEAFAGFTTLLGPLASTAQALGPSLLQGAVAGLTASIPMLIANLGALQAGFGAVSTFISGSLIPLLTNPLTLAILGVIATVGLLYAAWQNNWGGIRDITANTVSFLQTKWNEFSNWMQGALNAFVNFFKEYWVLFGPAGWIYHAWEENWFGIRDIFNNVASQIENALVGFKSFISDAWSGFLAWINNNTGPALDTLKNTFASGFQAIGDAISKARDWWENTLGGFLDWLKGAENTIDDWVKRVSDAFSGWAKGIQDWWNGLIKSISGTTVEAPTFKPPRGYEMGVEVPAMQKGGLVPETGLYLLHTGEYVVPPNQPAMNVTINLNVTGARGMDEKMLAEEAARQIERRLRSVLIEKTSSQAKTSRIRL